MYVITDACVYAVQLSATATWSHQTTALTVFGFIIALPIPLMHVEMFLRRCFSLRHQRTFDVRSFFFLPRQKLDTHCFFTLCNPKKISGPALINSVWAGASGDNQFVQQLTYCGATIVTMLVWRYYFTNRPWCSSYAACLLLIVPQLIVSVLVSQDILRDRLFYRLMTLAVQQRVQGSRIMHTDIH
ncbi:hypothetical protein PI124_g19150 [Phytophthora idaei]|nr:hypothetical protein PI124_g19150 [Phytophthora idaei]